MSETDGVNKEDDKIIMLYFNGLFLLTHLEMIQK